MRTGNALGFTYARGVPGSYRTAVTMTASRTGGSGPFPGYTDYTPVLLFWMKEYDKKETGPTIVPSPHVSTPTKFDDAPHCRQSDPRSAPQGRAFWQNGDRVRFTNSGGALSPSGFWRAGIITSARLIVGTNVSLPLRQRSKRPEHFDALLDGACRHHGLTGSGTTTIIVQDPTFTKLAHQVLTSANEYLQNHDHRTSLKCFATFMARVIEAPSVSFISGGGACRPGDPERGDRVPDVEQPGGGNDHRHLPGGTQPRVPSGNARVRHWASGNAAQGVLLLERIKDNSSRTRPLPRSRRARRSSSGIIPAGPVPGTVGVPGGVTDTVFRLRDNWILFYVGDPTGNAPADINPFNNYRGPILRNSVLWPPDSMEETAINNDNFTLLRFSDYVNTSLTAGQGFGTRNNCYGSTKDGGDVIRFTSPDGNMFYSPQSGVVFPTNRSEVGLARLRERRPLY